MKKTAIILITLITIFLVSYKIENKSSRDVFLDAVHKISDNSELLIEQEFKLKTIGTGGSMPGGDLRHISLSFDTRNCLDKDTLTAQTIKSAEILLAEMNSNPVLQDLFKDKMPFSINYANITIFNCDSRRYHMMHPEISTVEISNGVLTYRSYENDEKYKLVNEFKETYEEAKKRLGLP